MGHFPSFAITFRTKENRHLDKTRSKWVPICPCLAPTHTALIPPPVPLLFVANQSATLSFYIPLLNPCTSIFHNQRISPWTRLWKAAELKKWRPIKEILWALSLILTKLITNCFRKWNMMPLYGVPFMGFLLGTRIHWSVYKYGFFL